MENDTAREEILSDESFPVFFSSRISIGIMGGTEEEEE